MSDQYIRNTFTLEAKIIDYIHYYSNYLDLTKSKFIFYCISYTFTYMEIEVEDIKKEGYTMYETAKKKISNTSPITVTLPKCALDKFNYYCKVLDIKKSHMVKLSVIVFLEDLYDGLNHNRKCFSN